MSAVQTPLSDRTGIEVSRDELVALGRARRRHTAPGRRVVTPTSGPHASKLHGPGMEFSEVRAYTPGDDVRTIDWRVTARTGSLHSKLFDAERERPMLLGVDLGTTMRFATRGAFKSVVAARAASLLAWDAFESGERVGAVVWSPGGSVEVPAGRTRRHLMDLLAVLADGTCTRSGGIDDEDLGRRLGWLRDQARTGSRIAIVSDFYLLDECMLASLRGLARRCELELVWIFDAIEAEAPPAGRYRVSDGSATEVLVARADANWRSAYCRDFRQRGEQLDRLARDTGATLTCLPTDTPVERVLARDAGRSRRDRP